MLAKIDVWQWPQLDKMRYLLVGVDATNRLCQYQGHDAIYGSTGCGNQQHLEVVVSSTFSNAMDEEDDHRQKSQVSGR
ncbi:hypothetical protein G6F23_015699 [Rhizopus arrhizus]|nr:hypothetical protein G6F23_015699 [Rhizopus arrhizus]